MEQLIVYHGGTEIVEHPICQLGRRHLDFGRGFYITELRQQAVEWARSVASRRMQQPLLNKYILDKEAIIEHWRCKIFEAYDREWMDFIIANRLGRNASENYDYIEGGVANDRVIDTINLYMSGLMDIETALRRLAEHQPNNQICILNQEIIEKHLIFYGAEQL